MQCADVTERLLEEPESRDPLLTGHVVGCARCANVARGLARLDAVLTTSLVVLPPPDLQRQLAQLALDAAGPQSASWWTRLKNPIGGFQAPGWVAKRPQLVAQGLASVLLALASWQILGWVTTFQPVIGDIGYALELVAGSPAAVYLGGLQLDAQSFGIWSLVGISGWLISEEGLIGRTVARRLRLP